MAYCLLADSHTSCSNCTPLKEKCRLCRKSSLFFGTLMHLLHWSKHRENFSYKLRNIKQYNVILVRNRKLKGTHSLRCDRRNSQNIHLNFGSRGCWDLECRFLLPTHCCLVWFQNIRPEKQAVWKFKKGEQRTNINGKHSLLSNDWACYKVGFPLLLLFWKRKCYKVV